MDDAGSGRQDVSQRVGTRDVGPRVCTICDAVPPHTAVFCLRCRFHLASPDLGRVATAKRRLVAAFLDGVMRDGGLLGSVLGPTILPFGQGTMLIGVLSGLYWVASILHWTRGTTPAKRLFGMTVVTEDGEPAGFFRVAFRETIGKMMSTMVFGLGLLSVARDAERRGWHDKLFDTWVTVDEEP